MAEVSQPNYFKRALSGPVNVAQLRGTDPTSLPDVEQSDYGISDIQRQIAALKPGGRSTEDTQVRKQQNANQYALGLAAMLSGNEQFQNVGAQVLKQALGDREERVTNQGTYDPFSGTFAPNAEYQRDKLEGRLQGAMQARSSADDKRAAAREREQTQLFQQSLHDRDNQQFRMALAAANGGAGGPGGQGSWMPAGYGAKGEYLMRNTKSPIAMAVGTDGSMTPYTGAVIPPAVFEKQAQEVQQANLSASMGANLIAQVEQNPGAFGFKASSLGAMPASGLVTDMFMGEKELTARAGVLNQAAQVVHDLYGAALTHGEAARARAFIPSENDSAQMTMIKLRAAMKWAQERGGQFGIGVQNVVEARRGGQDAVPNRPGTQAYAEADKEARYQAWKAQHAGQ
jgi:hypothetical protein